MSKPKTRVRLAVEQAERRTLLSGATPVLTTATYDAVASGLVKVVQNLAVTHNTAAAAEHIQALASRIPVGSSQLAFGLEAAISTYQPGVPGSARATEQLLVSELKGVVTADVAAGALRVVGPGSAAFSTGVGGGGGGGVGAPQPAYDNVRIMNSTGFPITATVKLYNSSRMITQTIANGNALPFNFQPNTGGFLNLTVKNPVNVNPPAYTTNLNRPVSGYDGKLYTVTVFNGLFSVTQ